MAHILEEISEEERRRAVTHPGHPRSQEHAAHPKPLFFTKRSWNKYASCPPLAAWWAAPSPASSLSNPSSPRWRATSAYRSLPDMTSGIILRINGESERTTRYGLEKKYGVLTQLRCTTVSAIQGRVSPSSTHRGSSSDPDTPSSRDKVLTRSTSYVCVSAAPSTLSSQSVASEGAAASLRRPGSSGNTEVPGPPSMALSELELPLPKNDDTAGPETPVTTTSCGA